MAYQRLIQTHHRSRTIFPIKTQLFHPHGDMNINHSISTCMLQKCIQHSIQYWWMECQILEFIYICTLSMTTSSNGHIFNVTGPLRGIHQAPVNSSHKGKWRGSSMCSLICAWTNGWANYWNAGYLRRHRAHYDFIAMTYIHKCNVYTIYVIELYLLKPRDFR